MPLLILLMFPQRREHARSCKVIYIYIPSFDKFIYCWYLIYISSCEEDSWYNSLRRIDWNQGIKLYTLIDKLSLFDLPLREWELSQVNITIWKNNEFLHRTYISTFLKWMTTLMILIFFGLRILLHSLIWIIIGILDQIRYECDG